MLWSFLEIYYSAENKLYNVLFIGARPLLSIWANLWIEWLILQSILIYTITKLYLTPNYLKQVLATMWLVILLCLYLSLWQLELFACFLFLGEFTILIFFYCLLLHLKASVTQTTSSHNIIGWHHMTVASIIIFSLWFGICPFLINYSENQIAYGIDLYKLISDFTLNDLTALYYYFTTTNVFIHFLIGIILFVLTLFLFTTVTFYSMSAIMRKASFRSTSNKLFVPRGYYEQTSESSQKYFSQSSEK